MINSVEVALVLEHEDLVFQVFWQVNICFDGSLGLTKAVGLGNSESFASWRDARAVIV